MKKALAFLLVLLCSMLMIVACGSDDTDSTTNPPSPDADKVSYTVSWMKPDGSVISTTSVNEGETPTYTYEPEDTAEWDYTFLGWSLTADGEILSSIPKATANANYYAHISQVKQRYSVKFELGNGTVHSEQTIEYGAFLVLPEAPTLESYKFMGWSTNADSFVAADLEAAITGNTVYYASWNKVVDVKALLSTLLESYEMNPLGYIPESMLPTYSENLVDPEDIITDYSGFVNLSDVRYGFGEQWQMVIDNIEQSQAFFSVLAVVEDVAVSSLAAFNNYFDKNPSDTAHHEFENGIYNITVNFDGEVIYFVLDYSANLPVFGEQTVQIALSMDAESGERVVRIQIGDANALTYSIFENSYEFAIKYLGVRRAMISLERAVDGTVSGYIYEYLTLSGVEVASAADFIITDEYVSAVGNKASGLVGFTGYINELYNVTNGRLIGYEVQETLSSIVYNTLWFNLNDIDGIDSVKLVEATDDEAAKIFINGSSKKWESKTVGGIGTKMFSRRFDIEFRTQYLYSYDAAENKYTKHAIQVPMIFVQEENYDTFINDVNSTNKVTIDVTVDSADLIKLMNDYDTLIPEFILHKDIITVDLIIAFIGNKITFTKET